MRYSVLLLACFLSSTANVEANGAFIRDSYGQSRNLNPFRHHRDTNVPLPQPREEPSTKALPVPYAHLDWSRGTNPRHALYMNQIESFRHDNVVDRMLEGLNKVPEVVPDVKLSWWEKLSGAGKTFFWLVIGTMLLTIYSVVRYTEDKRNITGKG